MDTAGSLGYASRTYVVPDQPTANALLAKANPGDQITVDDAGLGEWTHFLVHDDTLRALSTQDSARVDAESLEIAITHSTTLHTVTVNGTAMQAVLIGNVSANRSITLVNIQVTAAFSATAVVTVGTATVADSIMPAALIDLTSTGVYAHIPVVEFTAGYTSIYAFVDYAGTTSGNATVTVSYV